MKYHVGVLSGLGFFVKPALYFYPKCQLGWYLSEKKQFMCQPECLADSFELSIIFNDGLKLCRLAGGEKLSNFSDVAFPGRIMAAKLR